MTKTATKTAGTEEGSLTAWDRSPKGRMCHAYARQRGVSLAEASDSFSAWLEIQTEEGMYLHWKAPVCTNCQAKVEAIAWESMGRLDTVHTETAAAMRTEAERGSGLFRANLEARGVKI